MLLILLNDPASPPVPCIGGAKPKGSTTMPRGSYQVPCCGFVMEPRGGNHVVSMVEPHGVRVVGTMWCPWWNHMVPGGNHMVSIMNFDATSQSVWYRIALNLRLCKKIIIRIRTSCRTIIPHCSTTKVHHYWCPGGNHVVSMVEPHGTGWEPHGVHHEL